MSLSGISVTVLVLACSTGSAGSPHEAKCGDYERAGGGLDGGVDVECGSTFIECRSYRDYPTYCRDSVICSGGYWHASSMCDPENVSDANAESASDADADAFDANDAGDSSDGGAED